MGNGLLSYLGRRVTRQQIVAFCTAFAAVLLVHVYKFTNTLPNHDSVYNYYSDQNVLGSGRWALSLICGLSSYFDLPWVNGLFCAVYIGMTCAVIASIFEIKNPVVIVLCGGLLAAAPATTETFFFMFTADGYMAAMLLAALAVWWTRVGENRRNRHLISGICICISCGIYQAYVSFGLVLAVCYFLHELLLNRFEKDAYFRWIRRQIVVYGVALAAYYVIWKLLLFMTGTAANDYQGISSVGVDLHTILTGFVRSLKAVLLYFLQWNVLEHGLTFYSVLSIIFLAVLLGGLVMAIRRSAVFRRPWAAVMVFLCLASMIPFACIWTFVSDQVSYRPMMLQSLTVLFFLTAVLYERWAKSITRDLAGLLLAVIVLQNGLMANISYFYMELCYERTFAEAIALTEEINDLKEEQDFEIVAFVGNRLADVSWGTDLTAVEGLTTAPGEIFMLSGVLEESLLFDQTHAFLYLRHMFEFSYKAASNIELENLEQLEAVREMEIWPAAGSMQVIDGILVIKLAESQ